MSDLKKRVDILAKDPTGVTDPFESIYEIVFQLTMRTVGCKEISDDLALVKATMRYNRTMELAGTPMAIMFPWLPSPGVIRKYYAGARMYMIFDKVAKARLAEGRREEDAMQVMLDQGDSVKDILGVLWSLLIWKRCANTTCRSSLVLCLQDSSTVVLMLRGSLPTWLQILNGSRRFASRLNLSLRSTVPILLFL